jgi:hypothetical protein
MEKVFSGKTVFSLSAKESKVMPLDIEVFIIFYKADVGKYNWCITRR